MKRQRKAGLEYLVIDENSVVALHLISLCKHHVITSSTYSFWFDWAKRMKIDVIVLCCRGAYLDVNQPSGGRTIVPRAFLDNLGGGMIPYPQWEIID